MLRAEEVSVAAAFDLSYRDLSARQHTLFCRLGLVPGPVIDAYAAAALDEISLDHARRHLGDLYDQHLLGEPAPGRYQLHDLLREHAQAKVAAGDPAESTAAFGRLLDYYLHTAAAANQLLARRPPAPIPPLPRPPSAVPRLATRKDAEAWLETERANLHAAAQQAAASGLTIHAVWIPAQLSEFLGSHGYQHELITLNQAAAKIAESTGDRAGQAAARYQLGYAYGTLGQYRAAIKSFGAAINLYRDLGDLPGQVDAATFRSHTFNSIDEFPAATASATDALALAREGGYRLGEADALFALSATQGAVGDYQAAATSVRDALSLYRDLGDHLGLAVTLTSVGVLRQEAGEYQQAVHTLTKALAVCRDLGDPVYIAIALLRLGTTQRLAGDYEAAASSLEQGLALNREMGQAHGEAEASPNLAPCATTPAIISPPPRT